MMFGPIVILVSAVCVAHGRVLNWNDQPMPEVMYNASDHVANPRQVVIIDSQCWSQGQLDEYFLPLQARGYDQVTHICGFAQLGANCGYIAGSLAQDFYTRQLFGQTSLVVYRRDVARANSWETVNEFNRRNRDFGVAQGRITELSDSEIANALFYEDIPNEDGTFGYDITFDMENRQLGYPGGKTWIREQIANDVDAYDLPVESWKFYVSSVTDAPAGHWFMVAVHHLPQVNVTDVHQAQVTFGAAAGASAATDLLTSVNGAADTIDGVSA